MPRLHYDALHFEDTGPKAHRRCQFFRSTRLVANYMKLDWLIRHLHLPPKRIILWHSVAAVPLGTLVALGAYLSYHYHVLADENRQRVNKSYQLLDGVDGLFASVEAAAIAERDFVITGDQESLNEFQRSAGAFKTRVLRLTPLVLVEPKQADALAEIDQAMASQFALFTQAIEVRETQGMEGARAVIALQGTAASMDALRTKIDALTAFERELVNERIRIAQKHENHVIISALSIALASLMVRLGVAFWVRRAVKRREATASIGNAAQLDRAA